MPSASDSLSSLFVHACNGNESALQFLVLFNQYAHGIDDVIDSARDGAPKDPEFVLSTFAMGCNVFSHPFYQANIVRLQPVVYLITSAYADSVKWEKSDRDGLRRTADVLRFCGNEMVFAIAVICGGYEHLRTISPALREKSWDGHHSSDGTSI